MPNEADALLPVKGVLVRLKHPRPHWQVVAGLVAPGLDPGATSIILPLPTLPRMRGRVGRGRSGSPGQAGDDALSDSKQSPSALVERFDETDHMLGWSSRGATEGGEPGIHILGPWVMDSGLAASRRPGMTPHVIRISKSLN